MSDLCTVAVCLSRADRGKVAIQWQIPAADTAAIIAEFRDRFGAPVLESTTEAAVIDEVTAMMSSAAGHVTISRA